MLRSTCDSILPHVTSTLGHLVHSSFVSVTQSSSFIVDILQRRFTVLTDPVIPNRDVVFGCPRKEGIQCESREFQTLW
jgi:hypothetical protein